MKISLDEQDINVLIELLKQEIYSIDKGEPQKEFEGNAGNLYFHYKYLLERLQSDIEFYYKNINYIPPTNNDFPF
jgi:hypothetical protein